MNTDSTTLRLAPEFDELLNYLPYWVQKNYEANEIARQIRAVLEARDRVVLTNGNSDRSIVERTH